MARDYTAGSFPQRTAGGAVSVPTPPGQLLITRPAGDFIYAIGLVNQIVTR
jgi:hypothetical protein